VLLTVATLNLHGNRDRWGQRRSLVVSTLLDAAPDVIALQQVALAIGQGAWLRNQLNARLAAQGSEKRYDYVQRRRGHLLYGWLDGVGILSALPILSADPVALGFDGYRAVRANLLLPDGHTVDVVSVRLHPDRHADDERFGQVMALIGRLHSQGASPHRILAGSFNAPPDSAAIRQLTAFYRYRSAWAEARGHELPASFPTALRPLALDSGLCLDYIFLSPRTGRVADVTLLGNQPAENDPDLYPSDHVGLLARIDLSGSNPSSLTLP
jgi:endonuclease/exonuclease/phosphatase family metal-dependent hydrolase